MQLKDVSADKTSVVSAAKTPVVSADKTSVVSADISQDISLTFSTQGRPRSGRPCLENAWGMSWEMSADTTDVLSADTTDVLAADTTDVLPADTAHVLPADNPDFLWQDQESCNPNLGIWVRKKWNLSMGG